MTEAEWAQDRRLRWMYDHIPAGVLITDVNGRVMECNPAFLQIVGYAESELAGTPQMNLVHGDHLENQRQLISQLLRQETQSFQTEQRLVHKNGELIWVRTWLSLILDELGKSDEPGDAAQIAYLVTNIQRDKAAEAARDDLMAETNDLIQSVGADGRILYANRAWRETLGYSEAELGTLNIFQIIHPDHREHCMMAFGRLMQGENVGLIVVCFVGRNGQTVDLEGNVSARIENGVLISTRGIFRDITERRKAEESLRASEQRFRDLFDYAPDAYFIMDREHDSRIISCNKAAMQMLGGSRDQIIGRTPIDFLPNYQPDGTLSADAIAKWSLRIEQDNRHPNFEFLNRRLNGEEFWVSVSSSHLHSGLALELVIWRDITALKSVEQSLLETVQRLKQSNEELGQFAYVASHDLQEPLRAISGCVKLLHDEYHGQLDASADELIGHTIEGAARMQNLINDLLAYSRVSNREIEFETTDLENIVAAALQNLETAVTEADAQITHDALPAVLADPTQLIQLFQNLLGNAIKFRADRRPEIHISVQPHPHFWQFCVQDNGIGISSEYFERIFEMFQRLHGREDYDGTGIGLAICKKIVERHGGRIWVESQPDQGTSFYFTIATNHQGVSR